jgi:cell division protein FtsA
MKVTDIFLEPIGSGAAVLTDEEIEAGVALIDIGGGTTDLTIFHEGRIRHTAVIPFGGNVITKDIKEGCSIMTERAEDLKRKFGSSFADEIHDNRIITIPGLRGHDPKEISERNLARIIQARVEEILDYVLYEVERSGYKNKLIGGCVITGGGGLLRNVKELCTFHTGMNARIGYPNEQLSHGYVKALENPIYATAIGLLIKGLEQEAPEIEEKKEEVVEEIPVVPEVDELIPEEEPEMTDEGSNMVNAIFIKAKEFFMPAQEHEFED